MLILEGPSNYCTPRWGSFPVVFSTAAEAKEREIQLSASIHFLLLGCAASAIGMPEKGVTFVEKGFKGVRQYALRPGYPAVWGGGCRESLSYKRSKNPPKYMNGVATLVHRGLLLSSSLSLPLLCVCVYVLLCV